MRRLLTILIITSITLPGVVKTGIWTWYETHKEEITQEFCINKDNPEMNCNGQCHLKSELQKNEFSIEIETNKKERPAPQIDLTESLLYLTVSNSSIACIELPAPYVTISTIDSRVSKGHHTINLPPPEMAA